MEGIKNRDIPNVAVIFDHYGHENKPFLRDWFKEIERSTRLRIRGFSLGSSTKGITELPNGGLRIWINRIRKLLLRLRDPRVASLSAKLVPVVLFDPDIVHIINAQQIGIFEKYISHYKPKVIISFRGYETNVRPFKDPAWKEELIGLFRKPYNFHFVSFGILRNAKAIADPILRSTVIYRKVDVDFFKPRKKHESNVFKILFVGRLTWQKGLPNLIRALKRIETSSDWELIIIGEGPQKDEIDELISELGLAKRIRLIGQQKRKALLEYYQNSDLFVLPSVNEAFPNVLLEAGACGLPLISTRVGGIPEFDDQENGITLVDHDNENQLASAIGSFANNKPLRIEMGRKAYERVHNSFSRKNELSEWEQFYSRVLMNKDSGEI